MAIPAKPFTGSQDVNGVPRTFGVGDRFTGIGAVIPLWFVPHAAKIKAAEGSNFKEQAAIINADYPGKSQLNNYHSLLSNMLKITITLIIMKNRQFPKPI